jgi:hypothetical protein
MSRPPSTAQRFRGDGLDKNGRLVQLQALQAAGVSDMPPSTAG